MGTIINILGSGAIGGLCAAGAQLSATPYRVWPRKGCTALNSAVLISGEQLALTPLANNVTALCANDLLIVPLKVTQLKSALTEWRDKLNTRTPVVLLHNGMGGMELANKYLPDNPVFLATTSHGAFKQSSTCVRHTGRGETMLGCSPQHRHQTPLITHITEIMNRCIGPVTWRDDIELALWQKLAVNCAINPLTAIHNIPNGDLNATEYRDIIYRIGQEVCTVAHAYKVALNNDAMNEQVFSVIEKTADNFSSMHQDVAHNRATEIEGINGYIVNLANKKGIDVPTNTLLYNAIKNL